MNDLLQTLAVNGLRGGVLILVVLLLRLLLRRTPRRVFCLLWGLAALRLLVPLRLTAFFGLLPVQRAAAPSPISPGGVTILTELSSASASVPGSAAETSAFPLTALLPWLWLSAAAGLLAWGTLRSLRLRRSLRSAVCLENGVWSSDRIRSPFAMGILRPRIYVPADLEEECLPWALAHERAHLKHGDTRWKAFGYVLLSVYWFQPLCWLGWFAFCRDLELACDERVTGRLPLSDRKAYALALLRCSAPAGLPGAAAFGEKPVSVRIRAVIQNRRQSSRLSALIGAACVLLILCLSFEAPASAQSPAPAEAALSALPTEPAGTEGRETVQTGTPLWTGENGSFAVSLRDGLPAALSEEANIRWESSGPMITADGSEAEYHSVVISNDPDLQLQIIPIRSGDGNDKVTLQMSGGIFGELNMEKSTEELSAPTGCSVKYTDAEGREIRWEIQTTP